jgi:hypothetical protein
MIDEIVKAWPTFRRFFIYFGFVNAPVAAALWLLGYAPIISGFFVFVATVVFLLGAKAEDDRS